MAKRRNATDVGKPPPKKKLSTEVTKIANAITGVARNPFAEKRKPKPAVTKQKHTKAEPLTTTNTDPSSTAIPTTPNFIIGPPPPIMSNLQPITTKISAAYGASSTNGVTKDRKSNHAQSPPNQRKKIHAIMGGPGLIYSGKKKGSGS